MGFELLFLFREDTPFIRMLVFGGKDHSQPFAFLVHRPHMQIPYAHSAFPVQ